METPPPSVLDTVLTGQCAATTFYGRPFFEWLAGDPEQVDRFSRAMANLTDGIKIAALDTYDFGAARHLVDVGAADGALLAHVLTRSPQASGVGMDLPHVVAAAQHTVAEFGLGARLRLVSGDFFEEVPGGGDTYLLSMILHDWDDERARQILANIRSAAPAGARVLSLELIVPPGDVPHLSTMLDLTMLGMMTGRERTEPELRALFERAGLRYNGAVSTPSPMSVVEATVP